MNLLKKPKDPKGLTLLVRADIADDYPTHPCQDCTHFRHQQRSIGVCKQIDADLVYCLSACCEKLELTPRLKGDGR